MFALFTFAVIIIALICTAIVAFLCCYIYPAVRQCRGSRTGAKVGPGLGRGSIKPLVLAPTTTTRSLFGLRPQVMPPPRKPRPPRGTSEPELLLATRSRHYGRLVTGMRGGIARPQPALSLSRGSMLSPSLSPSLSSSCSTSPITLVETPPMYSFSPISEDVVVVAPVDMGIPGQTVENRMTPKKGGGYCGDHKVEEA